MAENTAETVNSEADPSSAPSEDVTALKAEMEKMKRELASARAESSNEKSARIQAEQRGMSADERRLVAEESACASTIERIGNEADGIEADIARLADEPGHGAEIAKLNRKLAGLEADIRTEKQRQTWLGNQREQAKAKATEAAQDNGPELADNTKLSGYSSPARAWIAKHPKCFTDKGYLKRAQAFAVSASDVENIPVDTQEYFDYIDERLEGDQVSALRSTSSQDTQGEELEMTVERPQPRAAGPGSMRSAMATVAPPSRNAATATEGNGPRRVPMLSADQKEVADKLYADKFKNPADRYVHYSDMMKYQAERKRHGFGAN